MEPIFFIRILLTLIRATKSRSASEEFPGHALSYSKTYCLAVIADDRFYSFIPVDFEFVGKTSRSAMGELCSIRVTQKEDFTGSFN